MVSMLNTSGEFAKLLQEYCGGQVFHMSAHGQNNERHFYNKGGQNQLGSKSISGHSENWDTVRRDTTPSCSL